MTWAKGEYITVDGSVLVDETAVVWHHCLLRSGTYVGPRSSIGSFASIGRNVVIGTDCRVQDHVFIPEGVEIGDRVFVGPHVCFTNDRRPAAGRPFRVERTLVEDDVSIGAGAVILPGLTIGRRARIAAGAVVLRSVAPDELVLGYDERRPSGWPR